MEPYLDQGSALATILSFILQLVVLALPAIAGGAIGYSRAKRKFKKTKDERLYTNVQRPVALVPSKTDPLEMENRLLQAVDFFAIDLMPADVRSLDEITSKHRLAILRYANTRDFWRMFESLADNKLPLVIYAKPGEIERTELERIQGHYTRYTLCNTPVRLVSDVFAIMSVYPEDQ